MIISLGANKNLDKIPHPFMIKGKYINTIKEIWCKTIAKRDTYKHYKENMLKTIAKIKLN